MLTQEQKVMVQLQCSHAYDNETIKYIDNFEIKYMEQDKTLSVTKQPCSCVEALCEDVIDIFTNTHYKLILRGHTSAHVCRVGDLAAPSTCTSTHWQGKERVCVCVRVHDTEK